MKVWHLYKEYYLLKTEQGNLEQKLEYMALFSTNEDGTYDDKDRHIDIVYDRFAHDVIDRIKDNINFEFAYDIDKITDVLNEKNLIKKINMIKDIPEEATTQKIIYKLEENYVNEEGLHEICYGESKLIGINSDKKSYFTDDDINKVEGITDVYYPKSKTMVVFVTSREYFKTLYNEQISPFGSYDNFKIVYSQVKLMDKSITPNEYISDLLLTKIIVLMKLKKIIYRYMSQVNEITLENHLQNCINNLMCFVRDYCSESDINAAKFDKDQKEIIKLSARIGKSNSSSTSTKDDEVKLNKILHRRAKSMKDEDIISSFARAS